MFLFLVQRPTVLIDEHGHVECHKAPLYQRSRSCVTERPQEGITIESSLHGVALSLAAICVSTATDPVWTRVVAWYWGAKSNILGTAQGFILPYPSISCHAQFHHANMPPCTSPKLGESSLRYQYVQSHRVQPRVPNSGTACGTPCGGAENHLRKL